MGTHICDLLPYNLDWTPATLNDEGLKPQYPDKDDPSSDYAGVRVAVSADGARVFASAYNHYHGYGRIYEYGHDGAAWGMVRTYFHQDHGRYLGVGLGVSADGETVVGGSPRYSANRGSFIAWTRSQANAVRY